MTYEEKSVRRFRSASREERVTFYEQIFDELQMTSHENEEVQRKLCLLHDYYTSGKWLEDYEADEAGLFPADLKRGVLSQDGIYDLLDKFRYKEGEI